MFGIFGSEDGDEWAIPHSDYFEGLVGVRGQYFWDAKFQQGFAGTEIPLFELVYRDTIAMYAKYGYDIFRAADFVLYHLSIGRPLIYSAHPAAPVLARGNPESATIPGVATNPPQDGALFTRADHGWAEGLPPLDRFIKNTYEILSPLNELTAQMEMTRTPIPYTGPQGPIFGFRRRGRGRASGGELDSTGLSLLLQGRHSRCSRRLDSWWSPPPSWRSTRGTGQAFPMLTLPCSRCAAWIGSP